MAWQSVITQTAWQTGIPRHIIGNFLQSINLPRYLNEGIRFKEQVNSKAIKTKTKAEENRINNKIHTTFSNNNKASLPVHEEGKDYSFCNSFTLKKVLSKLPNET